mgnify:CR=1 FL=1
MMNEADKAAEMIRERGYDRAIWHAQIQKRGSTDQTKRAYWERVIEQIKEYHRLSQQSLGERLFGEASTLQELRETKEKLEGYRKVLLREGTDVSELDEMIRECSETLAEHTPEGD